MKRGLDRRVETFTPAVEHTLVVEIEEFSTVAENDNHSAWDLQTHRSNRRRRPKQGKQASRSHKVLMGFVR